MISHLIRFTRPIDPYRVLFPIGLVLGAWGALLWPLFLNGAIVRYPGGIHAAVMMGGFQLCIAAGFLMTAAPRFTGTGAASIAELTWALRLGVLVLLSALASAVGFVPERVYFFSSFLMVTFLAAYFGRRWLKRVHSPPPAFVFVGAGLACGVAGSLLLLVKGQGDPLGRALLYHAMMLGLVLGVGSRLITANLGWMQNPIIPLSQLGKDKAPWGGISRAQWVSMALCLGFVASFFLEVYSSVLGGRLLRAVIGTAILLFSWKLYHLPRVKTKMSRWLWWSGWCVLAGVWIQTLAPMHAVHGAHLMFIGGFSLMIFVIASRVTLSHGGFDLGFESRSSVYAWVGCLTLLSALLRTAAGWVPTAHYWSLVIVSAVLFLAALVIWSGVFLGKVLRVQKERVPQ